MLEIGIFATLALIFVILAIRFPKTKDLIFSRSTGKAVNLPNKEDRKNLSEQDTKEGIKPDAAVEDMEIVDELDKYDENLSKLLKQARDKINDGKYVSAEKLLIEAVCKDNRCSWAYEKLGLIYLKIGKNISDARESFEVALKINPESAESWFGLGKILASEGKFNKAAEYFQKAVTIDRNNPEYQAELGKAYLEIRQFGKAAKALKRAASLDISNQTYKDLASLAEDKHREHSKASKIS